MKQQSKKIRVFVGMSGGVDSSVSAALLKKAGYDVTGVFIKAWHPPFLECSWKEDRRDAMNVAALLDIPFITLDLEKEYKRDVIDTMLADYKKELSQAFGVLHQTDEVPLRATYIIDPEGIIRWVSVNDLSVGRNVKEVIRTLDALQTDELCPCNWEKGKPTLKG
jgi:hypothetical protein